MCFSPEKCKLFTKSTRRKIGKWIRNKKISIGSIKQRRFVTDFSSKKKSKKRKTGNKRTEHTFKKNIVTETFSEQSNNFLFV